MCSTDYELPSFYNETERKANKQHRCGDCFRIIEPKETYRLITGKWDSVQSFKQCHHCMAASKWLAVICHGWQMGGMSYDIVDHWDEYKLFPLGRQLVGIRNKWKNIPVEKIELWSDQIIDRLAGIPHH